MRSPTKPPYHHSSFPDAANKPNTPSLAKNASMLLYKSSLHTAPNVDAVSCTIINVNTRATLPNIVLHWRRFFIVGSFL